MAQTLYPGCDVWLNNPLRPLEACGTSGMKAALNGCLNLSVLDGWWDEMYDGHNGWAIPTADGVTDPDHRDDLEAAALYDLLEKHRRRRCSTTATPTATRRAGSRWCATRCRPSARRCWRPAWCATTCSALYAPAAASFRGARRRLRRRQGARGLEGDGCARPGRRCGSTTSSPPASPTPRRSAARWTCGRSSPSATSRRTTSTCRWCYGRVDDTDQLADSTTLSLRHDEAYEGGRHRYVGEVKLDRPGPFGYTARIVPRHRLTTGPGELGLATLPAEARRDGQRRPALTPSAPRRRAAGAVSGGRAAPGPSGPPSVTTWPASCGGPATGCSSAVSSSVS